MTTSDTQVQPQAIVEGRFDRIVLPAKGRPMITLDTTKACPSGEGMLASITLDGDGAEISIELPAAGGPRITMLEPAGKGRQMRVLQLTPTGGQLHDESESPNYLRGGFGHCEDHRVRENLERSDAFAEAIIDLCGFRIEVFPQPVEPGEKMIEIEVALVAGAAPRIFRKTHPIDLAASSEMMSVAIYETLRMNRPKDWHHDIVGRFIDQLLKDGKTPVFPGRSMVSRVLAASVLRSAPVDVMDTPSENDAAANDVEIEEIEGEGAEQ